MTWSTASSYIDGLLAELKLALLLCNYIIIILHNTLRSRALWDIFDLEAYCNASSCRARGPHVYTIASTIYTLYYVYLVRMRESGPSIHGHVSH